MTRSEFCAVCGILLAAATPGTALGARVHGTFSAILTGEQDQFSYFFDGGQYGGGGGNHQFIPANTYTLAGAFDYESDMSVWASSPGGSAHIVSSSYIDNAVATNGVVGLLNLSLSINGHTVIMGPQTSQLISFRPAAFHPSYPDGIGLMSIVVGNSTDSIFDHFQFSAYSSATWFSADAGIAQAFTLGSDMQYVSVDGFGHPANVGYFGAWLPENTGFQTTINFTMTGLSLDGGASAPEPASAALLASALGIASIIRRQRQCQSVSTL